MTNKSETYIIESIFIGALSFSGFLTIISSDKMQENLDTFRTVIPEIYEISISFILADFKNAIIMFNEFTISWNLFALVAIECLICSTFFIIVLATRIKFSNLTEKLDYLIRMANLFNSKEEEIFLLQKQQVTNLEARLKYLNSKIELIIKDSMEVITRIRPVFNFMKYFRTSGIYMFYIILITSGLFFSNLTTLAILGLIILGYFVRSLFSILSRSKIEKIVTKYIISRKNK